MAESQNYWGIDIGQAGLKAIRLRYAEPAKQAIAIAYDYVPHPKILSQPDANPDELIAQALETFLSRNDVAGDTIAISVPGQTSLARFIQLPPVEASKVAEIVKYEAKQQIPFDLDEVIWDYQPLGSGVEESGYMLDAEVGIFAMKRDEVDSHLQPFSDQKLEVELIQIAPLALYNMLSYDQLGIRPGEPGEEQDEFTIVCDMGADNTTLLVTNGKKIWLRNVPIGGNHFTRALTKSMKLTFAKAEHLKCNATKSPDPRAVFQALRPVFNDYVSEIQRSIGYFSSVNRSATIGKVIGVGNGFKLAGLRKFLQQNLQYEVDKVESFSGLVGDNVLNAPLFEENILTFVVPYGLALQAMGQTNIKTTLLPPEIATARIIRKKKPWAVVTAAVLLLGVSFSASSYGYLNDVVSEERFGDVEKDIKSFNDNMGGQNATYAGLEADIKKLDEEEDKLLAPSKNRTKWLELLKTINECLPRDVADKKDEVDVVKRNMIKLNAVYTRRLADVSTWYKKLKENEKTWMSEHDREGKSVPTGPGYIVTLDGLHFHDAPLKVEDPDGGRRALYIKNTLLKNLQQWTVSQTNSRQADVGRMGISHATLKATVSTFDYNKDGFVKKDRRDMVEVEPAGGGQGGIGRGLGLPENPTNPLFQNDNRKDPVFVPIDKTVFQIQFIWIPTPVDDRVDTDPRVTTEGKAADAKKEEKTKTAEEAK